MPPQQSRPPATLSFPEMVEYLRARTVDPTQTPVPSPGPVPAQPAQPVVATPPGVIAVDHHARLSVKVAKVTTDLGRAPSAAEIVSAYNTAALHRVLSNRPIDLRSERSAGTVP